jgi:hypothetical protein
LKDALPEVCADLFWSRFRVFEHIVKYCRDQNIRFLDLTVTSEQTRDLDQMIHIWRTARAFATLLAVALGRELQGTK